jgi:two-component system, NarL family, nitrate/nitrite response regulator NarL
MIQVSREMAPSWTTPATNDGTNESSMQAQRTKHTYGESEPNRDGKQSKLLLVGSEHVFKSDVTHRIFSGHQFRIAGRATTLLDALARLESEAIDLVLLSPEFCEEELSLFVFDARRRGFAGLILHVAAAPGDVKGATLTGNRELSGRVSGEQGWEGESREASETNSSEQHQVFAQRLTPGLQTNSEFNAPHGSISFTAKQQAVLTRVSEGWTNQQIAHHLKCSEGSVKAIIQQLFKKLGVRTRAQIVRMAFEEALMQLHEVHPRGSTLRGYTPLGGRR